MAINTQPTIGVTDKTATWRSRKRRERYMYTISKKMATVHTSNIISEEFSKSNIISSDFAINRSVEHKEATTEL